MKYRIIKRTLANGSEKYVVQKKLLWWWKDATYRTGAWDCYARYDTELEAMSCLAVRFNQCVSEEVVYPKQGGEG